MECASAATGVGSGSVVGFGVNSSLRTSAKMSGLSVKWNREESFAPSSFDQNDFHTKNVKREKRGPGGMRSIASAPDFSQLKMMHESSRIPDPKSKSLKNSETVRHYSQLLVEVQL